MLSTLNPRLAMNTSASGSQMNAGAEAIRFERDASTGYYRLSKNGLEVTAKGNTACMAKPNGSGAQLWKVRAVDCGCAIVNAATGNALDDRWRDTGEGALVWGTPPRHGHSLRRPNCPATRPAWLHGSSSVSENPAAAFHRLWATLIPKPTGKRISGWHGGYRRHEVAGSPDHAPA